MIVFVLLCMIGPIAHGQVVNRVALVDSAGYLFRLIESTMNEVERRGWCNVKYEDHTRALDMNLYGWEVKGNVTYKNGFLRTIDHINVVDTTYRETWEYNTEDNTTTIYLQASFRLNDLTFGFDVDVSLENGEEHYYTGILSHGYIQLIAYITKNMQREEMTFRITSPDNNAGTMIHMPHTNLTDVLQRSYFADMTGDNAIMWGTNLFAPIMMELANTTIPFPEVCYNCSR